MTQLSTLEGNLTIAVSLGIGLLIGIERERTKGTGRERRPEGLRTFALVGLLGGLCAAFDDSVVVGVGGAFVGLLAIVGYLRSPREDPGLTTEVALFVTFVLGALARDEAVLAAAIGVVTTILLASRTRLHDFASQVLSERELWDGLVFAAAALVVLPIVPNRPVGPYDVFNPFTVWRLMVLIMAISAFGYVARRVLGPRYGLPIAGFAGGFISASATIGTMGERARREPEVAVSAVAGALLANVVTILLMIILVGATSPETLRELTIPLSGAAIAAIGAGGIATLRSRRTRANHTHEQGRAFDLRTSIVFAATLTGVVLLSAALTDWLGSRGLIVGAAVAGFADTHSAAISAAALAAAGTVSPDDAARAVLAALSTNTVTKLVVARVAGGRRFAARLAPGLVVMVALAWIGALLG